MPKQARAGLAPERHPDPPLGLGQPAGASCAGPEQLGQALGEGASGTGRVAAVEPAHPQLDPDRPPERGQVGRAPPVAAVDGPARAPAVRAAAAGARAVRGDVEEPRAVGRDPLDAAARHGAEFVHAPSYGAPPAVPQHQRPPPPSTQSAGEPRARERLGRASAGGAGRPEAGPLSKWRLHDLRRTTVTGMAELGVQPHIIEAVVNRLSGRKAGVAGVYNRATYAGERRDALAL